MFLPSLPIRFSLPTIYHHVRTVLLCLPFPPDFPPCPSCCLFYCFLSTRVLRNRKFACTAEESRLFTNPKQQMSYCLVLLVTHHALHGNAGSPGVESSRWLDV